MRFFLYYITIVACVLVAVRAPVAQASSQLGLDIAAVLNGEIISTYDVDSRIKFIIATTNLSNTPEVRAGIRPQIVRALIDERLQLADAEKNGITVSDEEVARAVAALEKQRNMSDGAIMRMLAQNGVSTGTFSSQVRAQLAWNKLVMRKIRPYVTVSEDEAKLVHVRMPKPAVRQELKIAPLVLAVDKPARDAEVKALAQRLAGEVRGGASFEEIYRQFSGSGNSPEPFWVKPEQLDPAIAKALGPAQAGMVTPPVRTSAGYTIIRVYDARSIGEEAQPETVQEVALKEILLRLKPEASVKEADILLQIGEEVAKNPGTCQEEGVANIDNLGDFDIMVSMLRERMDALPPALRIIAGNLRIGEISSPFASSEGIRLYMLCDRKEVAENAPDMEQLKNMLYQQKMDLEVQKYLRNLRREAFIEIRG